ncbi:M43 family zinc metalloprotease [Flavobacterium sp.]|uniref:M43 family zinc metalloprotease n=1 Tax=Flavobacterium sp. TaxID=239 RepID=UPI003D0D149D
MIRNYIKNTSILALTCLQLSCNKEQLTEQPTEQDQNIKGNEFCLTDKINNESTERKIDPWVEYDYNPTKIYPKSVRKIGLIFNILETAKTKKITDAQVQKQVDILNQNFKGEDPEIPFNLPLPFIRFGMSEPSGISFFVKKINRKTTRIKVWDANGNDYKLGDGIMGGNGNFYLNIWILDAISDPSLDDDEEITGFAINPGVDNSSSKSDFGVVTTREIFFYEKESHITYKTHNRSKTLTHEVGHCLGLYHMTGVDSKFNEVNCGDDKVSDTPTQAYFHYDYLKYPYFDNCHGQNFNQMFMNYMDYTPHDVRCFFTNGQINRMRYFFQKGKYNSELGTKK